MTLQKQDDYSYHHSVACSVWAVVLGRHLGFDRRSLDKLAIGGMLLDIGKTRVPQEILSKPDSLSPHEADLMCQHVDFSMDMVKSSKGISRDILDMVESHHERYDGSGYPRGLSGADIPVYGRIAGIVIEQNRVRRLRPKVMLCLDDKKQPMTKHATIDLRKLPSKTTDPKAVWISHGHEAGAFGIEPGDYFM